MVLFPGKLYDLRGTKINTVVEITEEEKVVELVCQVKLVQPAMLQSTHPFHYVVIVLVPPVFTNQTNRLNIFPLGLQA